MDNRNCSLRFGDYTLDTAQGLLYLGQEQQRLTPKLVALLTLLVERRGTIVSRAEIARTLWPNTVVEEGGLPRNISMLRKHLDRGDGTRYIENLPKRGYRFVAEVTEVVAPCFEAPRAVPVVTKTAPRRWWRHPTLALASATLILCIVSIVLVAARQQDVASPWRMIPLTNNSAALPILSAGISPDGRLVAYIETNGSDAAAYVRLLHSAEAQALPSLPGVAPSTIRWYGDNSRLLLSGFDPASKRYVAWSASILGGPPTVVLTDAYKISPSKDARRLAFYRNLNQIWLADGDGGAERLFATAPGSDRFRLLPQFSPDGKYLIVGRVTGLPYSPVIEAHRLSDGEVTQIFDPNGRAVFDMLLLPSGELLVSMLVGYDASEVVTMRVDFEKRATSKPTRLMEFDDIASALGVSADGKQLSVVRDHSQPDVYLGKLDVAGTALTDVRRVTLDNSWDRPTAWLDDRTILFNSNRHGSRGIYKQRIDELHAEPVVVDERENSWPVITPDGQWLWYFSMPAGEYSPDTPVTLMRRPAAGGPARDFGSRQDRWRGLRCSRGGTCIRVEQIANESVFYSFDPTDGSGSELARTPRITPFAYFSWDISPDGKRLAFVDRTRNVIGILDLGEKPVRRSDLTVDGYEAVQGVSWDPNGAGLYLSCFNEDDSSTLYMALSGEVSLLRHQPRNAGSWAKPSADGHYLLLADSTKASNIWLFERPAAGDGAGVAERHVASLGGRRVK